MNEYGLVLDPATGNPTMKVFLVTLKMSFDTATDLFGLIWTFSGRPMRKHPGPREDG
jgi:hypothetical protein